MHIGFNMIMCNWLFIEEYSDWSQWTNNSKDHRWSSRRFRDNLKVQRQFRTPCEFKEINWNDFLSNFACVVKQLLVTNRWCGDKVDRTKPWLYSRCHTVDGQPLTLFELGLFVGGVDCYKRN
jgi:hypothetical protein